MPLDDLVQLPSLTRRLRGGPKISAFEKTSNDQSAHSGAPDVKNMVTSSKLLPSLSEDDV